MSFEEAQEAFYDDWSLIMYDAVHSFEEDRYFQLGLTKSLKLVVVVFCIRNKNIIRVISARFATRKETEEYEKQRN